MKKVLSSIALLLLAVSIVFSSCAKADEEIPTDESTDDELTTLIQPITDNFNNYIIRCSITPTKENLLAEDGNFTMFSKSDRYYYLIKIGQMRSTPVSISQKYYYDGNSVKELEFKNSTIDVNTVRTTIQRKVESHTEWSSTIAIPNFAYGDLEIGSIVTNYQFQSKDYFEQNELEQVNGTATISSTSLREQFDSTRPAGNWAYMFFANIDVYASIVTDRNHNVLDVSTQTKVTGGNYDFQYLGDKTEPPDYFDGDDFVVNLESQTIKRIINQTPTIDITGNYSLVRPSNSPVYCGNDKNYTAQSSDNNSAIIKNPSLFSVDINGAYKNATSSNLFILSESETTVINAKILQDIKNLETTDGKSKAYISSDKLKTITVFGGERSYQTPIGQGAVIAKINYRNGSSDTRYCMNIMDGKNNGDTLNLLDLIELSKDDLQNTKKIEFVLVYEIESDAGLFAFAKYTNWKYEFSVEFGE